MKTNSNNLFNFNLNYFFDYDQFFIIMFDFSSNEIILNQYEYKEGYLKSTIRKVKTEIDIKKIDYCNLTYKSKFLFIAHASQSVSYLDLKTTKIISSNTFNEFDIKLSDKFQPVPNTDDFILLATKPKTQNLVISYFELKFKDGKYVIDTFETPGGRSILNFKLNESYLCLIDYIFNINEMSMNTKAKINVFNLAQIKHQKPFERSLFDLELRENLNEFCLSYDNSYLFLVETLNLCIFRIKDKRKMVDIPLTKPVVQIWTHEKNYINLILANGELVSLLLIDCLDEKDNLKVYENVKKIRYVSYFLLIQAIILKFQIVIKIQ